MAINGLCSLILFFFKIKKKLWAILVAKSRSSFIYTKLYSSFWHKLFNKSRCNIDLINYYTTEPNPGAGIGHQMANWIAGYWFAKEFGLKYAHSPFSKSAWDEFLGFGQNETVVSELVKVGYKKVRLPLFDEFNISEGELQKKIIASYNNKKVIFISEQDQGYRDQFGVMESLKMKFFNASARVNDRLFFDKKYLNIVIHVRRGDIVIGQHNKNPNFLLRWQGNEYFVNVLRNVLSNLKTEKLIAIYLFSQGKMEEFADFNQFKNLQFCLDVSSMDSFLHMVFADVLIISKSSFSYKPALLNNGIKVCPEEFWHGYPETNDWIMADESGDLLNDISLKSNE
jgi:hypothetical protein